MQMNIPEHNKEEKSCEQDEIASKETNLSSSKVEKLDAVSRKSFRRKRPPRAFSPDLEEKTPDGSIKRKVKSPKKSPYSVTAPNRPCDFLENGQPFCCDLCKSPYVVNRLSKRALKDKRSKHNPMPVYRKNQNTGKTVVMCNACNLSLKKTGQKKLIQKPSEEEKEKYLEEAKAFAKAIAEKTGKVEASRLYCPHYKNIPCNCLKKYLGADGDENEIKRRTHELCDLLMEAQKLSKLKCYQLPENGIQTADQRKKGNRKKSFVIGLGNGNKKSKEFECFVMEKRTHLKENLGLCERAVQKVLMYSNNFLHKKLKTEERPCRLKPQRGKRKLGLLPSFDEMAKNRCCVDNCVMLALTHRTLLKQWRERSSKGQAEARRVIAEMLVPSAGARCNCYNFISLVTGTSRSTICLVNYQMQQTGGDREPPVHGLKKYFGNSNSDDKEKSKDSSMTMSEVKKNETSAAKEILTSLCTGSDVTNTIIQPDLMSVPVSTNNQILEGNLNVDAQRQQLTQLQQIFEQQQQQQQHLQQQLLQQTMAVGQMDNSPLNVTLMKQMMDQLSMQIQNTQLQLQHSLQQLSSIGTLVAQQVNIVPQQQHVNHQQNHPNITLIPQAPPQHVDPQTQGHQVQIQGPGNPRMIFPGQASYIQNIPRTPVAPQQQQQPLISPPQQPLSTFYGADPGQRIHYTKEQNSASGQLDRSVVQNIVVSSTANTSPTAAPQKNLLYILPKPKSKDNSNSAFTVLGSYKNTANSNVLPLPSALEAPVSNMAPYPQTIESNPSLYTSTLRQQAQAHNIPGSFQPSNISQVRNLSSISSGTGGNSLRTVITLHPSVIPEEDRGGNLVPLQLQEQTNMSPIQNGSTGATAVHIPLHVSFQNNPQAMGDNSGTCIGQIVLNVEPEQLPAVSFDHLQVVKASNAT